MQPKVILDTNVLVSGLRSSKGAAFQLLLKLPDRLFIPCVSVPLFYEYESVLKRPELLPHLDSRDIDEFLNYFLSVSSTQAIFFLWRPFLKDPKDDLVLEAAVASQSDYLITYNLRDFQGVESAFGIRVLTPQAFFRERGII